MRSMGCHRFTSYRAVGGALFAIMLASLCAAASGGVVPRVAVSVEASEKAAEWQAVVTTHLSQRADLQVVEREELSRILEERARIDLASVDGATPPPEALDLFLHARQLHGGRWLVEAVEAATGRLRGSATVEAPSFAEAGKLAAAASRLISAPPREGNSTLPRVAVIDTGEESTMLLAARLRAALAGSGFPVLDRALAQTVAIERNDADRGLRDRLPISPFLGADYLVDLQPRGQGCEVRLLSGAEARLVASETFAFDGASVIDGIQSWLLPNLAGVEKSAEPYLPTVEVEALGPFYRGMGLFDSGRFIEASIEFTRAWMLNRKFGDALEWEARCYDSLGMKPLSDAARRYARIGLLNDGPSGSARSAPADAVAFLGVRGEPHSLTVPLSAIGASVLASDSKLPVRLPENLDRLRREFDWMAGLASTEGPRWEEAPSLFCRFALNGVAEVADGELRVAWTLRDAASGQIVSRTSTAIGADPALWRERIRTRVPEIFSQTVAPSVPPTGETDPGAGRIAELERELRSSHGVEANAALLKLALADPGNPLVRARAIEKGDSERDGLEAFLAFGLRDWILARLPPGSLERRWLELMRLHAFSETEPVGRYFTGENIDEIPALEAFAAANPDDAPGLVASFSVLAERRGEMPPGDLARACDELLARLRRADRSHLAQVDWLVEMTTHLRDTARVAEGDASVALPPYAREKNPQRIRVRLEESGDVRLVSQAFWIANEHAKVTLDEAERINEARAMLAIGGRPSEHIKLQDRWLKDFPRSICLTYFAAQSLHELNFTLGVPLAHPLDWEAERRAYLEIADYVVDSLGHWIAKARTTDELDYLETIVWRFVMALNEPAFGGVVSDARYSEIQAHLASTLRVADRRVGRTRWGERQQRLIAWQELTREQSREMKRDSFNASGLEHFDPEILSEEIEQAARESFGEARIDPAAWWRSMARSMVTDTFTAKEVAELYLRHTAEVVRFTEERELATAQSKLLLQHAEALFFAGFDADAEILFKRLVDPPETTEPNTRAKATLRLAQLLRLSGRTPEAIETAHRGIDLLGGAAVPNDIAAQLIRLLREIRFDPARARLPEGVDVVSVETPNGDNPRLNVFYRLPATARDGGSRVLVVIPSYNEDVLDLLRPGNAWARFAEEEGMVLVCPQFYCSTRFDRMEHRFTAYGSAQVWSGEALLDALDRISAQVPIEKRRLLLHGYGGGAIFASKFARWRPQLVAAASVHSASTFPWFQEIPGLQPMVSMRDVRFLVTTGEADDLSVHTWNRHAQAEAFVTVARGVGVDVEWHSLPGVNHVPGEDMEILARAFLQETVARSKSQISAHRSTP